jgi:hypothetical protein
MSENQEKKELVRLNYIGSKHQLYDFIKESIFDFTKYSSQVFSENPLKIPISKIFNSLSL